ncbi:hypothetical protein FWJ25_02720 [Marinobacter salinexigens]|uniref:Uncharacterized protein n=1 Tax=Marinobacter salinexigens TaxID=2919747 RepID=A0A5B0VNQ8_9GAMM|nr:hypothetical protein [Marinobacter salinexigens]KAA1176063.1 hypothetical protein FWJ25_02720 [Marinobacter salinexigens]
MKLTRENRFPVSTIETGCVPFNLKQKAREGYKVGENPVKDTGEYVDTFTEALERLRAMRIAGWRDYGAGNSQGARRAIGWVTKADAERLLGEKDTEKRIALYRSIIDVVL